MPATLKEKKRREGGSHFGALTDGMGVEPNSDNLVP
jgi:hypothetical protein